MSSKRWGAFIAEHTYYMAADRTAPRRTPVLLNRVYKMLYFALILNYLNTLCWVYRSAPNLVCLQPNTRGLSCLHPGSCSSLMHLLYSGLPVVRLWKWIVKSRQDRSCHLETGWWFLYSRILVLCISIPLLPMIYQKLTFQKKHIYLYQAAHVELL